VYNPRRSRSRSSSRRRIRIRRSVVIRTEDNMSRMKA
jgi:hypothetical protein